MSGPEEAVREELRKVGLLEAVEQAEEKVWNRQASADDATKEALAGLSLSQEAQDFLIREGFASFLRPAQEALEYDAIQQLGDQIRGK